MLSISPSGSSGESNNLDEDFRSTVESYSEISSSSIAVAVVSVEDEEDIIVSKMIDITTIENEDDDSIDTGVSRRGGGWCGGTTIGRLWRIPVPSFFSPIRETLSSFF